MEQFPNNNNPEENTNQEPTDADVLANMPSFEEMRRQNAVPEGVRDEQDYREYQAEQQARNAEQGKADSEFIEHSKAYVAEVAKIENPSDRYLTTALLNEMTIKAENDKNRQTRALNTQNLMLEFINRKNKNETIIGFIDSKINNLKASGVDEAEAERIYKNLTFTENRIKNLDEMLKVQAINDAGKTEESLEELEDELEDKLYDNGISANFNGYRNEENDKGTIINMTNNLLKQYEHEENDGMRTLIADKITVMSSFYRGESFKYQTERSKGRFYENVTEALKGGFTIEPNKMAYMMAIMQSESEFNDQKKDYEEFQERIAEGQQILDNFKNNSEA